MGHLGVCGGIGRSLDEEEEKGNRWKIRGK